MYLTNFLFLPTTHHIFVSSSHPYSAPTLEEEEEEDEEEEEEK
jgi:hypothetical protein